MQEQAQRAAAVRGWCPTAWQPMMAAFPLIFPCTLDVLVRMT